MTTDDHDRRLGHRVAILVALLIGVGVGYWAHGASAPDANEPVEKTGGLHGDVAPADVGLLATGLTDGEWWTHEKGSAFCVHLQGGHGRGAIALGNATTVFGIHLSEFDLVGAKVQFLVEHDGEISTWLATLDLGDPEAPLPTESELEAERYEVIPMTIHDVYGRFCSDMTPFRLWRKYPGPEVREVDRLRRLVTEEMRRTQDR